MPRKIGVLALQGGFAPHAQVLAGLGHTPILVRDRAALEDPALEGLVLPGGESTTHLTLLDRFDMNGPLDAVVRSGRPVFATCAGLILAAREVTHPEQRSFGWIDVSVARNAWGRQVHSFEDVTDAGDIPLLFIRAPRITQVGEGAEVLGTLRGEPVLVRQGNVWGASFHPELIPYAGLHARIFGGH